MITLSNLEFILIIDEYIFRKLKDSVSSKMLFTRSNIKLVYYIIHVHY